MRIRVANSLVLLLYSAMAVLTAVVFSRYSEVQQRAIAAAQRQLLASTEVSRFLAGSRLLTSSVQSYAASGEERFSTAYWRELFGSRSRDRAAEALQRLSLTAPESALLQRARSQADTLVELEQRAMEAGRRGDRPQALALVFGPAYQQALQRLLAPSEELQQRITRRLAAELARERQQAAALWHLCLGLLAFDLLLVFVVLALVYPRFIIRPLLQLDRRLQTLGAGEPPPPLQLAGAATEIQDLAESLATQERLARQLAHDQWAKAQQVRISAVLQRQTSAPALGAALLAELAPLLPLGAATVYGVYGEAAEGAGALHLLATYATSGEPVPERLQPGEGLVGECLRLGEPLEVQDLPPGYRTVVSGLGHAPPHGLLLLPVLSGSSTLAVLELALLSPLEPHQRSLVLDLLPFVALALEGLEPGARPTPPAVALC